MADMTDNKSDLLAMALDAALANEVRKVFTAGLAKITSDQVPILHRFCLDMARDIEFRSKLKILLEGALTGDTPDAKEKLKVFKLLVGEVNLPQKVEVRYSSAAKHLRVEVDTMRRKTPTEFAEIIARVLRPQLVAAQTLSNSASLLPTRVKELIDRGASSVFPYILAEPEKVRIAFNYKMEVSIDNNGNVETEYGCKRVLPKSKLFSIFILKNDHSRAKILSETEGVLNVEVCNLSDDEWKSQRRNFDASLHIDNVKLEYKIPLYVGEDYIAFEFDGSTVDRKLAQVDITTVYGMNVNKNILYIGSFDYFCVDGMQICLTLKSAKAAEIRAVDRFVGFDGTGPTGRVSPQTQIGARNRSQHTVKIGPDTLIWPHSGVEFHWDFVER